MVTWALLTSSKITLSKIHSYIEILIRLKKNTFDQIVKATFGIFNLRVASKTPKSVGGPWKCKGLKEQTEGWLGVRLDQVS